MCPYNENCKIQRQYAATNLCQDRYASCAGYMYAGMNGAATMPDWMTAIDYALLQKNSADK